MKRELLDDLIADILRSDHHFLDGLHRRSSSFAELSAAVIDWARRLGRPLDSLAAGLEPAFRQSILFSLIPSKALQESQHESYDSLIKEHAENLGVCLSQDSIISLRNLIINVVKLRGLDGKQARGKTSKLGDLKADHTLYHKVLKRQGQRCVWCGVDLHVDDVKQSLEHLLPKHLGDDPPEAKNWAIACSSCNEGKRDAVAWATLPWAYDYFERTDFERPNSVSLQHRWTVLRRDRQCLFCGQGPTYLELHVFKRVSTGLPIPSNCGTACLSCGVDNSLNLLDAEWTASEETRPHPKVAPPSAPS